MKRVLIITYYWPPSGGAGVQRWLKMAKYLRKFGWEPIIYTPENPEYPVLDTSLENEVPQGIKVIRQPITEPQSFYNRFVGGGRKDRVYNVFVEEGEKPNWRKRLALFIRANLFVPDARVLWVKPSVQFLGNYIRTNPVDLIVSTGPPHSMHLIAEALQSRTGLKWLADFRDPWTSIDYTDEMPQTAFAARRNARLELSVLQSANHVVVVSSGMQEEFSAKTDRPISLITNGFDSADFPTEELAPNRVFTLLHSGSINHRRNHPALWEALSQLKLRDQLAFRVDLVGKIDQSVSAHLTTYGLEQEVELHDYVAHDKIVRLQRSADLLLLLINGFDAGSKLKDSAKGILTGKIFEYLATGKPILAVGAVGSEVDRMLNETGAGMLFDYDDITGMKSFIAKVAAGDFKTESRNIAIYSREHLAGKMANLFDGMV